MNDRIGSVCRPQLDAAGQFHWPAEQADRDALASRLLGACVVAGMDEWADRASRQLRDVPGLTADQATAAEKLVAEAVRGVFFSVLVNLDQFPHADLDLVLSDPDGGGPVASIVGGDINELHDRIWEWLAEFSNAPARFGAGG